MQESNVMRALETRVPPVIQWAASAAITWLVALAGLDGSLLAGSAFDVIGIVVALAGLGLAVSGGMLFNRASTTVDPHKPDKASALVTSGVYGVTRNPMYLGLTLIVIGWALVLGTVIGLFVGPAVLVSALTFLQIKPEERALGANFGAEYHDYRNRVRRWL